MSEETQGRSPNFVELAVEIASAYVANNSLPAAELPALIGSVHTALHNLAKGAPLAAEDEVQKTTPAQIRKSITPDALISFIDGRSYKTLKRHLTGHGLNPDSYRQRFGLPSDYPMVAASYAAQRSELAKSIGLGRAGVRAAETVEAPKSRGRRKSA
ncbi:MucR family transcriptional regulator [Methylorubrum populi]|uniref:MucR family transcriptional regulator n=1 Tax=Methylorubrum rhodesianum TaxID=29427 RepID=A0ABU9Z5B8_9HYPH|nr:MucR family transcriptional regulator [Methylorubrum rhodesianum]MBK3402661.1 MucR family transcriptional regulator [Methylorubrum rhodesianum]MBY0138790.1 MucR family transcriptional regulator [Methylorubrum populi]